MNALALFFQIWGISLLALAGLTVLAFLVSCLIEAFFGEGP